jgi:hypothetical protein
MIDGSSIAIHKLGSYSADNRVSWVSAESYLNHITPMIIPEEERKRERVCVRVP